MGEAALAAATAVLLRLRTDSRMHIDLSAPIWGIEEIAAASELEVDSAREYT
jgi:hypothetical protein